LFEYFENITEAQKSYIPNFKYHLIDLTQYSDEAILSLKTSFLINSLIAFKHKNDSDYVRNYADRIYYKTEIYSNSDYKQLFIRSLTVYIMASSKMDIQEVLEIIETLPKDSNDGRKSALESLIDIGIKRGIEQGTKREEERSGVKTAIKVIKMGLDLLMVYDINKVPMVVLKLLKANIDHEFKDEKLKIDLAKTLIEHFEYLQEEDIVVFSHIEKEEVGRLKEIFKKKKK
jgi:hypothetical protein